MHAFAKIRQISIYPRLVFTFLLVILPICSSGLALIHSAQENVKEQILQSTASNVHFYLSTFQQEWSKIIAFQRNYLIDENVQYLNNLPGLTEYEKLLIIRSL